MTILAFAIVSLLLFMIGAVIGSFLNVVIYRTLDEEPVKKKESWAKGRSRCDSCGSQIAWYDNIPIVSFLWLRGRCRHCQKKISVAYPVVELLTGALFVWWYWGGAIFFQLTQQPLDTLQPLFWLSVGILLLIIFLADAMYYIIPDVAVVILTAIVVMYRLVLVVFGVMQPTDLVMALVGMVVAVGLLGGLWLLTKGKGIGLGDVKLMVPLSLLLGWPAILVNLFLAFVLGAIVGVLLIAVHKKKFGQTIPFGPFLITAACITLLWGDQIYGWYIGLLT